MATIRLNSLKLTNFRSFKEASFQFPERGLVLIQGFNRDTGGSSGSGKSNLAEALAYLFDYSSFPATELQSWFAEDGMAVEGHLEVNEAPVVVRRGAKPVLTVDGNKVAATAASVKSALPNVTGLTPELMKALCYRPQRKPGMFLTMGDTDKKSFLSTLLGLGKFEEVAVRETKAVNAAEEKLKVAEALLANAKMSHPLNPGPPQLKDTALLEDAIKDERRHLDEVRGRLQEVVTEDPPAAQELRAKIALVQDQIKRLDTDRKAMAEEIRQKESILMAAQWEAKAGADKLPGLRTSLAKYRVQMEAAVRQRCPTCTQEWLSSESQDYVTDLQSTIDATVVAVTAAEAAEAKLGQLGPMVAAFGVEKERILSHYDTSVLEATRRAMQSELERLMKGAYEAAMTHNNKVTAEAAEVDTKLRHLEAELSAVKVGNAREEANYLSLKAVWDRHLLDLDAKEKAFVAAADAANEHRDYLGMVKGFLAAIFDEVLVEVAAETNAILAGVPNVQHVTIAFETESQTQAGTIKQAITPVVSVNGSRVPLRSGLSGGQAVAVELAVDVALGSIVSRRTGVVPGFLVLDESLDGLDLISKEGALDILAKAATDRLILVVDHATEVKERFSQVVEVEYAGGCSVVV